VLTKREIQSLKKANKTAGIDVGIKEFAIIHDGENTYHIENPKYLQKSEKRLIKLQYVRQHTIETRTQARTYTI